MQGQVADLHRAFADAVNRHDLDAIAAMCHPEVTAERPGEQMTVGAAALVQMYAADFAAFPDLVVVLDLVLARDATVFTEYTIAGTHLGEIVRADGSIAAPTGRRLVLRAAAVDEWHDDRLLATRIYWDQLDVLRQLGLAETVGLVEA